MILNHLEGGSSSEEKEVFTKWLDQSAKNQTLYDGVKYLWNGKTLFNESHPKASVRLLERFTLAKIKFFILNQALGHLIGFIVGMWVTNQFSHTFLEKRGIKNLFGLAGRKKIVVNEIPEWMQTGIAIIAGFIVLELINHFFQTEKHLYLWAQFKKQVERLRTRRVAK